MINHKSYRAFHDIARSCSTSLSHVVDAENKRQQIERERAVATRARNKAYWQSLKSREGETQRNGGNEMYHIVVKQDGKTIIGVRLLTRAAADQLRQRYEQFGYQVEVTEE